MFCGKSDGAGKIVAANILCGALALQACAATVPKAKPGEQDRAAIFATASSTHSLPPLPSPGCRLPVSQRTQPDIPGGSIVRHLSSGEHQRTFLLSVPTPQQKPVPLVLNLPGLFETPALQQIFSRMQPLALERGWVVAWPEGIGDSWNADACCARARAEKVDDVQFMRDLVAQLGREMCIDLRRVYATGMSNGGFMSYRLACEASDLVAAIAPVAGVEVARACTPKRAVPVLAFNGTRDHVVPYDGRAWSGFTSVAETFDRWRARNHCGPLSADEKVFQVGDATCSAATQCAPNGELLFCAIERGGHTWPGGMFAPYLGHTSHDVDASRAILDFFSAHARP